MIKLLVSSILLLLACGTVIGSADDDYFQKAIFPVLKAKNGQFSSESLFVNQYDMDNQTEKIRIEEKHSFKWISGNLKEYQVTNETKDKGLTLLEESIYLNGTEFYLTWSSSCVDFSFDSSIVESSVSHWASYSIFKQTFPYKMLGEYSNLLGSNFFLYNFFK